MAQNKLGSFKGTGKAGIPQSDLYQMAGIDEKTGLPSRVVEASKISILPLFRIIDEQDFCNRFIWENIPMNLSSQEIERLIYYYHDLMGFEADDGHKYLMPYVLDGTLDFYTRFNTIHPVPLKDGPESKEGKEDKTKKEQKEDENFSEMKLMLAQMKRDVIYSLDQFEQIIDKEGKEKKYCVILKDFTRQRNQTNLARWDIIDDVLKLESDIFNYLDLAMLTSSGVKGMRVPDANAASEVVTAGQTLRANVKNGIPYVAITSPLDFQDLSDGPTAKINEYFLALQSLDNFRLSSLGIDNLGVYEKGSHILESENNLNQSKNSLILNDAFENRKLFCDIFNKIFDTNMTVKITKPSENSTPIEDDDKEKIKKESENFEEEAYE